MKNINSKSYDLLGPAVAGAMIEAAETEDAMGCVLRMHLLCEYFLSSFIDGRASPDMKSFIGPTKYFSEKLRVSVALGLPTPFAAVLRHINKMRNQLAHEDLSAEHIADGDVQQLARLVDALVEVDPSFHPLCRRFIETPVSRPGVRMIFGQGDKRVDFIIAVSAFLASATSWLHQNLEGGITRATDVPPAVQG